MSLGQELAPHLPFLRRYARALTGSQTHGDAFVRATLEAIVAKPDEFPREVDPRLGLYRTFHAIWSHAIVAPGAATDVARRLFFRGHGLFDWRESLGRRFTGGGGAERDRAANAGR